MRQLIGLFGSILATSLVSLPASAQALDEATVPSANEVIDRYVNAIGGRQAILAQQGLHVRGTVALPGMGLEGDFEMWTAPDRYRESTDIPQVGTAEVGFDGTVGWSMNSVTGASLLTGRMLEQVRESARLTGPLHEGSEIESLTVVGASQFDGRAAWELAVTTNGGESYAEHYDRETGLLLGFERVLASPMGNVPTTVVLDDYRPVAGVLVPWVRTDRMMGVEQVATLISAESGPIPETLFAPPAHVEALRSIGETTANDREERSPGGGDR